MDEPVHLSIARTVALATLSTIGAELEPGRPVSGALPSLEAMGFATP